MKIIRLTEVPNIRSLIGQKGALLMIPAPDLNAWVGPVHIKTAGKELLLVYNNLVVYRTRRSVVRGDRLKLKVEMETTTWDLAEYLRSLRPERPIRYFQDYSSKEKAQSTTQRPPSL